jgi:hypothetical protein
MAERLKPPGIVLLAIAALVALAGIVMSGVGGVQTGVSWDEPAHVERLNHYLDDGRYSVSWKSRHQRNHEDRFTYAPVSALILHGVETVVGVTKNGRDVASADAYETRHLSVAAIGALGLLAVGALTALLLGSWRWGVVGAACLAALPIWTGQSMFNLKDVPVATGITIATLALALASRPGTDRASRWWGHALLLGAGIILSVGTRPGVWPLIMAEACVWAISVAGRASWQRRLSIALSVAASYLFLAVLYPWCFADPLWWWHSVTAASHFRAATTGHLYLANHLVSELPVLLLGALLLGLVYAARGLWRTRGGETGLALVVTQMLLLPVLASLEAANLYSGLRQMLFMVPAAAVLMSLGLAWALSWPIRRRWALPLAVLACVSLVAPTVTQAGLFPYQYAWTNPVASAAGADPETDYWRTSFRAMMSHVPTDGVLVCSPAMSGDVAEPWTVPQLPVDCRTRSSGPLAPYWTAPIVNDLPSGEFYSMDLADQPVPTNCTVLYRMTRSWLGRTYQLGTVQLCSPPSDA